MIKGNSVTLLRKEQDGHRKLAATAETLADIHYKILFKDRFRIWTEVQDFPNIKRRDYLKFFKQVAQGPDAVYQLPNKNVFPKAPSPWPKL